MTQCQWLQAMKNILSLIPSTDWLTLCRPLYCPFKSFFCVTNLFLKRLSEKILFVLCCVSFDNGRLCTSQPFVMLTLRQETRCFWRRPSKTSDIYNDKLFLLKMKYVCSDVHVHFFFLTKVLSIGGSCDQDYVHQDVSLMNRRWCWRLDSTRKRRFQVWYQYWQKLSIEPSISWLFHSWEFCLMSYSADDITHMLLNLQGGLLGTQRFLSYTLGNVETSKFKRLSSACFCRSSFLSDFRCVNW